jgi:ABC-type phosphate/phosphonate transport system substrate-binding protein
MNFDTTFTIALAALSLAIVAVSTDSSSGQRVKIKIKALGGASNAQKATAAVLEGDADVDPTFTSMGSSQQDGDPNAFISS